VQCLSAYPFPLYRQAISTFVLTERTNIPFWGQLYVNRIQAVLKGFVRILRSLPSEVEFRDDERSGSRSFG